MSSASKKQRHAAKRKAKRLEIRRQKSISPVKRLTDAHGTLECWMSEDFESFGQASIFVYKQAGTFGGAACFLIDRGVVGLKDAYVQTNITRADLQESLEQCNQRGIPLRDASIDEVRRLVAGAIRWTCENGMRLPKKWNDPVAFIGGVGHLETADVSLFVKEFVGHPEDLRQRLISEPFETYVRRKDIDFVFSIAAPHMNQGTGEYDNNDLDEDDLEMLEAMAEMPVEEINELADRLNPIADALAKETTAWLLEQGKIPSNLLSVAWQSVVLASLLAKATLPDAPEEQVKAHGISLLDDLASRLDHLDPSDHGEAIHQAMQHMEAEPALMQRAILKHGLPQEPSDPFGEP